MNIRK